jgi:hypothetical protein
MMSGMRHPHRSSVIILLTLTATVALGACTSTDSLAAMAPSSVSINPSPTVETVISQPTALPQPGSAQATRS